ncbi:restriction endonuclease subunit S [Lactococcus lactis]|uniref:restriction endonuclease subunit S n=1 Tax=Lactococcus lactis TaxID=1358 RepID=UPI003D0A8C64
MKEKLKAPELRFDGFTDDWEERKLGDIFVYKQGQQVPVENQFTKRGKNRHRFIRIVDLTTNNEAPRYIEYSGDNIISSTDLFMIRYGQPGVIGYGYEGVIANNLFKLIPKIETYNLFFKYILDSMYPKIQSLSSSTTMPAISFKSLDVLAVRYPDKKEQEKIGSFFAQLDNTIALHQRKLDLLKEQKKGYLQKMFPKNGEKVPELRFAGFADDWEERKFKDIIEKLTGGASIKPSDYLEEGIRTIPKGAVNSTGLADLSGSKYISEEFYESNKSSHVSTNNLVTSLRDLVPSAPNMGRIVRIAGEDEDFLMPQGVYKLELFDGMDEEFLIAFSNSDKYRKIISSEKNGSTQVHIRNGEFLNIDIELPFSEEQKQIGSFFKQLDNSIALHQHKLDLLKEQKKGFLQKMFV